MKMAIGNFLFLRLQQLGINHVFGVPGDFNLQLLEQINEVDNIEFVGTCNELNASYAADGYARMKGMGALLTTYGVGDLSAINGIAGAAAEHIPVVFITGTPPLYAMESRLRMHHSLAEGNFDNIRKSVEEFTVNSTRLTPTNAVEKIDYALRSCWHEKMPVYIQVPSNISYLEVEVPEAKLVLPELKSDEERLESATKRIVSILKNSENPLLVVDMDVERSGLTGDLFAFVEKRQIPFVALRTGKGILPESSPLYLGQFNGPASTKEVLDAVNSTDCLIETAPYFLEGSPMVTPQGLLSSAKIYIRHFNVTIEGEVYEGVTCGDLIEQVTKSISQLPPVEKVAAKKDEVTTTAGEEITQKYLWNKVSEFLRPNDVLVAENGTSLTALLDVKLPCNTKYIAQPIWGSIGYSLPALLGSLTADDSRRQILFIGDGSFQLTAQELSTILNRDLKPIIFLLNNKGYTIERYILGMNAEYNDVANWKYSQLVSAFAPDVPVYSTSVSKEDELEKVLNEVEKRNTACFIELQLAPDDAPESMKTFGSLTADLDYGPRGPQK